ncbi:hypothetical protein HXX76_015460 [Chlamydomonas incerta]|uniref:Uncharacterized protein n=1 Tax=Chlamydomonas incerta TaxID=51695 RepID=A0A835VRN1_CHLIN|nr:hypothetical protein HXX76_015460 [Chlamydomonas incerta]|eukprot:KAG2423313.1 hypothetical protein HXX76_015460 [Chlamydomonas incerta]
MMAQGRAECARRAKLSEELQPDCWGWPWAAEGPPCAAQTPAQQHTAEAGSARGQGPSSGGSSAAEGWWSAWLPAVPLLWSAQSQTQQPQPAGSAITLPSADEVAAAAASHAPAVAAHPAEPTSAVLQAPNCCLSAATAPELSLCRRRRVERPGLGQDE